MNPIDELPDGLADEAADLLLRAGGARNSVLAGLVRRHPQHEASLHRLAADLGGADALLETAFSDDRPDTPEHIGGHRVLRVLGEGSFGVVYLCAQERPVARHVAVKVCKPSFGGSHAMRRFEAERQLLAALNHPAITPVYDAGTSPDGLPYFVMEFVDGVPIGTYCERHGLSHRARVALLAAVCRGVAHAHQRGIVHRDLKPQNVLVVDADGAPQPKIIDFGIAKAPVQLGDATSATADGHVIGTPGYMSPEQAGGGSARIDQRADVYAFGVMLYELLTGELPWAGGASARDPHSDAVLPSVRVATGASGSSGTRRQLAAALRGDLDWIVVKALAYEPAQRFRSAAELADDLERYLCGRTVSVGPPTLRYWLGKLLRRHRAASVAIAALTCVVALGAALSWWHGASVEARERRTTHDAQAAITRLLEGVADPRWRDGPGSDAVRQQLVRDAIRFYDGALQQRPRDPTVRIARAQALVSLSQLHLQVGELRRAEQVAAVAVAELEPLSRAAPHDDAVRILLADALRRHGRALAAAGSYENAHPLLQRAVAEYGRCAATSTVPCRSGYAAAVREAAATVRGDRAARHTALRDAVRIVDELAVGLDPATALDEERALVRLELAARLGDAFGWREAHALLDEATPFVPTHGAGRDRVAAMLLGQRGRVTWELGDRPQAIVHFDGAVAAAEAWCRQEPHWAQPRDFLLRMLRSAATARNYVGDFEASSAAFRSAAQLAERMVDLFPEDPSRVASLSALLRQTARVLWDRYRRRDLREAAACARRAAELADVLSPAVDTGRGEPWSLLLLRAGIATSDGESADALWHELARQLPEPDARASADVVDHLSIAYVSLMLWHERAGRVDEAERLAAIVRAFVAEVAPHANKQVVEIESFAARRAAAAGDGARCVAAAEAILAARDTWFGRLRAGQCLLLAVDSAPSDVPGELAVEPLRQRAARLFAEVEASLQTDVGRDPDDPWFVVPWAVARLATAELLAAAGDAAGAQRHLADALPALERVRADTFADQWPGDAFAAGRALQDRLAR